MAVSQFFLIALLPFLRPFQAYQNDLDADLVNLSASLDAEIEHLQTQEPTEDDFAREETYVLAEDLSQSLTQMESSLRKVVGDFNKAKGQGAQEGVAVGDANPVAKVSEAQHREVCSDSSVCR